MARGGPARLPSRSRRAGPNVATRGGLSGERLEESNRDWDERHRDRRHECNGGGNTTAHASASSLMASTMPTKGVPVIVPMSTSETPFVAATTKNRAPSR